VALSTPFVGSGEFVPERVWSCPDHEQPEWHECDCQFCTWEQPACCQAANWVDRLDADGNVVMREMSVFDAAFRNLYATQGPLAALGTLSATQRKIAWLEDQSMPRIVPGDG
jgi:hypothetical protein